MINLVSELQETLRRVIAEGNDAPPHVKAFAGRLLGPERFGEIAPTVEPFQAPDMERARYEGFPYVAALGFGVAATAIHADEAVAPLLDGLRRLCNRFGSGSMALAADDIALLGLAEGLRGCGLTGDMAHRGLVDWLVQVVDAPSQPCPPYARLRRLAGDLLDGRGRLRMQADLQDRDAIALELALQAAWPTQFVQVAAVSEAERRLLLRRELENMRPVPGEVDRAAILLKAVDVMVYAACLAAVPTVSATARLLSAIQPALKRWRWEERPQRQGAAATRWLIDDEYDVQALLWSVLYPVFQADLVDETYLPNWGHVQPRADLAIRSLRLIIEVKIARQLRDFRTIEEEVAGDLGLYFKNTNLFDRMIVFVYDDCDDHRPERYDSLINALRARERIEEVIIIRRPGMIPARGKRA